MRRQRADVCYSELGSPGWREPLDCVRASELCNQNSQCSSRYRIMRQCLSGGDKERSAMLASKECQGALEVLQDSPLYDCRCKRGMKKELQCLQNYWSIHMGLTEGLGFAAEAFHYAPTSGFVNSLMPEQFSTLLQCPQQKTVRLILVVRAGGGLWGILPRDRSELSLEEVV
ncbi:GDNF family receptor alpha-2 [Takifugu flavidus]|uniref:GDNF family receptor alpha-2 n=1 Tax=Takifugu flavidus TaxID=433684 RepID=A0A5C6NGL6_9TELE|nr:GDNF family receptor alpha-2 [Takifugu flavidus]